MNPTSIRNGVEVTGAADSDDDAFFIGDSATDGSWKIYSNGGVCTIAVRVSGAWEDKHEFDGGDLTVNSDITAATVYADTVVCSEGMNAGGDFSASAITGTELTVDDVNTNSVIFANDSTPADPNTDSSVMWVDETSGDLMIKINLGDVIKTATIVDFSAI